ncbi:MAG: 2-oxoacid:ferredoxin oxidoreductase subunit beta [Planctomycetes bacterium]|nr:2-oxoacid:ferredoxin oxidoreductase subunit beta [Planctomycetota bacterium]
MSTTTLTKKDYKSDQEVRWCPGCGDYAILNAVQGVFAELQMDRAKTVIVSGIGCSSRFPYYMSTYGFHTIHGRAPAVATGIKLANPDLDVWVVTGDGDGLSIGGNHFIHALRRNVGLKVMLFNNRIYGLTKGQYSPTSLVGAVTKSSPSGALDNPFTPVSVALGAGAAFVARSVDIFGKHLQDTIRAAAGVKGSAFVEILQNCNIFNDGAWEHVTEKGVKDDNVVELRAGKPLQFGKEQNLGLRLRGFDVEKFNIGSEGGVDDCIVWNPATPNPGLAFAMAQLNEREMPTPIGVFRDVERANYEQAVHAQIAEARAKHGDGDLKKLLHSGDTWTVS